MDLRLLDAIDDSSCVAIIPARGGSKSVPKKNIRLIYNHPMIAYSIAAAKLSELVQRVIVSTDSEEIAEISKRYGAEVPFLRPEEYAQDDSPDIDFMKHAIQWFYENEGSIPGYIVHLRPTTPIRDPKEIDKAVDWIRKDEVATSLRSGSICVHPPYKWFKKSGQYLSPLMPGMTCDEVNLPRQDFPEVYIPNGYVDIVKADFIIKNDLLHGDKMIGYKTDEIPDVDTEMDLKKITVYDNLKENLAVLCNYLNNVIGSKC
jgi:N-acylneuraminate cytidylyltransferase